MKRSPLKRSPSKRRKREADPADFTPEVRRVIERRSGGRCEAVAVAGCRRQADQVHHRLRRSQGGLGTISNGLHVCAPCHTFIHGNPALSRERGWLLASWDASAS